MTTKSKASWKGTLPILPLPSMMNIASMLLPRDPQLALPLVVIDVGGGVVRDAPKETICRKGDMNYLLSNIVAS